jgi:nicotinate-nucleotide pyrophosphorylase
MGGENATPQQTRRARPRALRGMLKAIVRLCGSCNHRIGIGTKEALAVEMDDVVGIFGNPDLGFP